MEKPELPRMQHLAWKMFGERRCIDFVTEHGITNMMQMHPNLMCAPTVQFAFNQTGLFAPAKDSILGFGCATSDVT